MSEQNTEAENGTILQTGIQTLDAQLDRGGIKSGTTIGVSSPAHSVGRRLCHNLCADRPVVYCGIGHDPQRQITAMTEASSVTEDNISTYHLPVTDAAASLENELTDVEDDINHQTTILIDPINVVEREGVEEIAQVMDKVTGLVTETEGLAILHAIREDDSQPDGRWMTESLVDAHFRVSHIVENDEITAKLILDRLPVGETLENEDSGRTYELPLTVDMSLNTERTISA